jgi:hypothetical protein
VRKKGKARCGVRGRGGWKTHLEEFENAAVEQERELVIDVFCKWEGGRYAEE